MRRVCDEIWILDLGGEGRGPRRSDNVFAIQTPVAIAVALRTGKAKDAPAKVRYASIEGSRQAKLAALDRIDSFGKVDWDECPKDWQAPFRPAGRGPYFDWPHLTDLMPWQHSGVQSKRTWPVGPDRETLERRWRNLMEAGDRSVAFRETADRTVDRRYSIALTENDDSTPIAELHADTPVPNVRRYAYRSFDLRYFIADGRLLSRPRPVLWRAHGKRQIYLTSLLTAPLGRGPAVTACSDLPDLHHFSGRGAKDTIPLYRNRDASEANILPGLLDMLGEEYRRPVTPEDFVAYIYGVLAHPAFSARFERELEGRELRAPITKDPALFENVGAAGARLLRLHTRGTRFVSEDWRPVRIPPGAASCIEAVPGSEAGYPEAFSYDGATRTLRVGAGAFAPVTPEIYGFEVSGLKPVQSWLAYRMKKGAGRRSSPLDDIRPTRWTSRFTTELLELLWILEATVSSYPEQARLFDSVVAGACFHADDLPSPGAGTRAPPVQPTEPGLL